MAAGGAKGGKSGRRGILHGRRADAHRRGKGERGLRGAVLRDSGRRRVRCERDRGSGARTLRGEGQFGWIFGSRQREEIARETSPGRDTLLRKRRARLHEHDASTVSEL